MKYKFIKNITYSLDGFNPTSFKIGDIVELDQIKSKDLRDYIELYSENIIETKVIDEVVENTEKKRKYTKKVI